MIKIFVITLSFLIFCGCTLCLVNQKPDYICKHCKVEYEECDNEDEDGC